jgi:hypothetical protein
MIYKLTFPNGKIYIGMTTASLRNRLYCHRFKAKADAPKLLIHRAWKLHGEPLAEILAVVADSDLSATEIRAIRAFCSFGDGGYNMTPGGEDSPMKTPAIVEKVRALALTPERIARNVEIHLGSKRSPETREEMSRARKGMRAGIPKSTETRRKISEANKGKYHLPPGRKNTEATKAKMSESAKRRWADPIVRQRMSEIAKAREAKKRLAK